MMTRSRDHIVPLYAGDADHASAIADDDIVDDDVGYDGGMVLTLITTKGVTTKGVATTHDTHGLPR